MEYTLHMDGVNRWLDVRLKGKKYHHNFTSDYKLKQIAFIIQRLELLDENATPEDLKHISKLSAFIKQIDISKTEAEAIINDRLIKQNIAGS